MLGRALIRDGRTTQVKGYIKPLLHMFESSESSVRVKASAFRLKGLGPRLQRSGMCFAYHLY